jgi:hypothetical protein
MKISKPHVTVQRGREIELHTFKTSEMHGDKWKASSYG